ncbi:MAG: hypothetical protein V3V75_06450 [Thermoguttaceae bacterium]
MRTILMVISLTALGVLLVTPTLHAAGLAPREVGQYGIFIGTVGWFATAPFWIKYR